MASASDRPPADQEKDALALLRRAKFTADRTSTVRKEFLKRLVELSHSPHAQLKKLAAQHFKECFRDFPELENDVINAIYDLCEDSDAQVRMKGYEAINDVSAADAKWVKRNVDVLVQLLQTEDRDEVLVVKRALTRHMDLDARATWTVFCDQISPASVPKDNDERESFERIRQLLLAYLANEAQPHIERHAANRENEQVLVEGLTKALSSMDEPSDARLIVDNILLRLPRYKNTSSDAGSTLLDAVQSRAETLLGHTTDQLDISDGIRGWIALAFEMAVDKTVTHPYHFASWFKRVLFTREHLLRRNLANVDIEVTQASRAIMAIMDAPEVAGAKGELSTPKLNNFIRGWIDSYAVVYDVVIPSPQNPRSLQAAKMWLTTCQRLTERFGKGAVHNHQTALAKYQAAIDGAGSSEDVAEVQSQVQELIRFLLEDAPRDTANAESHKRKAQDSPRPSTARDASRPAKRLNSGRGARPNVPSPDVQAPQRRREPPPHPRDQRGNGHLPPRPESRPFEGTRDSRPGMSLSIAGAGRRAQAEMAQSSPEQGAAGDRRSSPKLAKDSGGPAGRAAGAIAPAATLLSRLNPTNRPTAAAPAPAARANVRTPSVRAAGAGGGDGREPPPHIRPGNRPGPALASPVDRPALLSIKGAASGRGGDEAMAPPTSELSLLARLRADGSHSPVDGGSGRRRGRRNYR